MRENRPNRKLFSAWLQSAYIAVPSIELKRADLDKVISAATLSHETCYSGCPGTASDNAFHELADVISGQLPYFQSPHVAIDMMGMRQQIPMSATDRC